MPTLYLIEFPLNKARLTSTPCYKTTIISSPSQHEVRNAEWQDPLYKYNAAFALHTKADVETLVAFFHNRKGREQAFLVKDELDYNVTEWTQFAEDTDGSRTQFQLIKRYVDELDNEYQRPITKPASGSISIRKNSVTVDPGDFTVGLGSGTVTFDTPPANDSVVEFKCTEFFVPVRFDTDELPMQLLMFWVGGSTEHTLVEIPDIPLIEVRDILEDDTEDPTVPQSFLIEYLGVIEGVPTAHATYEFSTDNVGVSHYMLEIWSNGDSLYPADPDDPLYFEQNIGFENPYRFPVELLWEYHARIRAVDTSGNESAVSDESSIDLTPP